MSDCVQRIKAHFDIDLLQGGGSRIFVGNVRAIVDIKDGYLDADLMGDGATVKIRKFHAAIVEGITFFDGAERDGASVEIV